MSSNDQNPKSGTEEGPVCRILMDIAASPFGCSTVLIYPESLTQMNPFLSLSNSETGGTLLKPVELTMSHLCGN